MQLKNRFWFWSGGLIAPLLLLGGISVWNLFVQGRAMRAATSEYELSDRAKALTVQVGWLRDSLAGADARSYYDLKYFSPISIETDRIVQSANTAAKVDDGDASAEKRLAGEIPAQLQKATAQVSDSTPTAVSTAAAAGHLDQLLKSLTIASALGPEAARRHVIVAEAGISTHTTWALMWFAVALVVSGAVHYKQYRVLVQPLVWLRDDMRRSAATEYRNPVRATGDVEYQEVAIYFNGLARELAGLYRNLEEKVIARSRELVRSERLASVGFLAAGVAHEINNPLSVISGYAELSTKAMRRVLSGPGTRSNGDAAASAAEREDDIKAEAEALSGVLEAQGIIREEAFRCKEITSRLLSLARGGSDNRELLPLNKLAEQVAILVKGLRNYRDRRVVLDFAATDSLDVLANATEMKQVLLNLTVNAFEATHANTGQVRISGKRCDEWIECSVEDNGKGMSRETLDQIFEPFFTAKRGAGEPGTGLGLSITHAIIENHGGRIRAESPGPGQGSRFTFRLPIAKGVQASARESLHAAS